MIQHKTVSTSPKRDWSVADVVDFEVFLGEDEKLRRDSEGGGEALLDQSDRKIYLDHIKRVDPGPDESQCTKAERCRVIFRAWVDERRKLDELRKPVGSRNLLGKSFADVQALSRTILAMLGVFCGFVVVILHSYFGNLHIMSSGVPEPANVLSYLGVCVLLPAVLVLGVVLLMKNPWHLADLLGVRLLFELLAGLIAKLVTLLMSQAAGHMKQDVRERMQAGMGTIRARLGEHGSTLKWPFLLTLQCFGLGFAASVPLTTMGLMVGSDRAFGWQTSMTRLVTPARLEGVVRVASFPWRWMPVAWATQPNAESIRNSQVIYISGGKNLTDEALKSWGPFLVLCTAVWGFLPRATLFVLALRGQRKALAMLALDDHRCDLLFRRLTTPLRDPPPGDDKEKMPPLPVDHPHANMPVPSGACVVLVSYDVKEVVEKNKHLLEGLLTARHAGWRIHSILFVGKSAAEDRDALSTLEQLAWADARKRQMLYLHDASAPPIEAKLDFLQACRTAAGEHSLLTVGLIGTPEPGAPFPAAQRQDVADWQRKIDSLGELSIGLVQLNT